MVSSLLDPLYREIFLSRSGAAIALVAAAVPGFWRRATTGQEEFSPCTEDAMIVCDVERLKEIALRGVKCTRPPRVSEPSRC